MQVPTWRPDSTIEIDVIEEVARHYGMANLPKTVPVSPHTGELSARQQDRRAAAPGAGRCGPGRGDADAVPRPG